MSEPIRVYVAGASNELSRARAAMEAINDTPGCQVAHDWVSIVERSTCAERDIPRPAAAELAGADLSAVVRCDLLWLLAPIVATKGAWAELGAAVVTGRHMVVSGDCRQSIFCACAHFEFTTDADALSYIRGVALRIELAHCCPRCLAPRDSAFGACGVCA